MTTTTRDTNGDPLRRGKKRTVERLLIKVEEAAELLEVGRSTVYDLMRTGELASVRIGRSRRVPLDALRAYIAGLKDAAYLPGRDVGSIKRGA